MKLLLIVIAIPLAVLAIGWVVMWRESRDGGDVWPAIKPRRH